MGEAQSNPEFIERLVTVEQSAKSAHHRIDKLEENQEILLEMNGNIRVLTEQTKKQNEELGEVKKDVKDLKEKPAKRWDLIITVIITASVTGIISFILAQVLK
jgi:predicted ribosome quality control (RQC) complex YloA/Tae2 family protein